MPKFLKFIIRPRILILWLWVILFSSVMYSTLTFDAHAILGVPGAATTTEIKKAYRGLSKRYHPDHNKTLEAREMYIQVRRAYKSLVDREAFEEEEAKNAQSFSVGVALPSFLTSGKHDGVVLFGLLSLLFAVPAFVWYKFSNDQKHASLIWRVRFDRERVERFMLHMGIPVDPKYADRRDSRARILQILIDLGIAQPNVREDVVAKFPPLHDFIMRCIEADKNATVLTHLGLSPDAIKLLQEYMVERGVSILDEFDAEHANVGVTDPAAQMLSPSEYRATRYLFYQHTSQVDNALQELLDDVDGRLPSARRLMNLHVEMYDLLDLFYGGDRANKQVLQKLMQIPQRVADLVDSVEPDLFLLYKRSYRNFVENQLSSKEKRLRKKGAL